MKNPETLRYASSWVRASDHRVRHAEQREQPPGHRDEQAERRDHQPDPGSDVDAPHGALGMAGPEILARDRRRRAHESDRRPRNEGKQLTVAHGVHGLRLGAPASEPM